MSRSMRTYFYAVLGGIGGLIGWQVSNMLGLSFGPNLYVSEMLVGALVGLCVGLFIGITEGVLTRNLVQAAKSGLLQRPAGPGGRRHRPAAQRIPLPDDGRRLLWARPRLGLVRHADRPGGRRIRQEPDLEGHARRVHRRRDRRRPARGGRTGSSRIRSPAKPPAWSCWALRSVPSSP